MRPLHSERPRLRKREVVLAVAAGVVAAGGAALVLSDGGGGPGPVPPISGPNDMTYQVSGFDEISTTGPQDIVITIGESTSVRAEGSGEALAHLEAVVEGGTLAIRPKSGFNWGNWRRLSSATFYVTLPRLESLAQAGSGDVRIDRIAGESFESSIAGSGELAIAAMEVEEADFNIGGAGTITANGTARETRVSIAGSGEFGAAGLQSETASISIAGSGDVELTVMNEAKVSIVGSGDVDIAGPGRCSVSRFGSGEVSCEGGSTD